MKRLETIRAKRPDGSDVTYNLYQVNETRFQSATNGMWSFTESTFEALRASIHQEAKRLDYTIIH